MYTLKLPSREIFIEETNEFIFYDEEIIELEHSLVAISKWESKWHKPYLSRETKTTDETMDYIRCMCVTPNIDYDFVTRLSPTDINNILAYIEDPMSATKIVKQKGGATGGITTSEKIYYWMVALQIPVEFETWHLNRLLNLIEICNIENSPKKKMSKNAIMQQNASLNAARRQALHSKG